MDSRAPLRPLYIMQDQHRTVTEGARAVSASRKHKVTDILQRFQPELLDAWVEEQRSGSNQKGRLREADLRSQCTQFLGLMEKATQDGDDINGPAWAGVRELLEDLSRSRAQEGFSPSETAAFIFSFKKPFFARLRRELADDAAALADETWKSNEMFDRLGLYTTEVYQKGREEVIARQQQEMLELSTPVIKLWEGVLALPLIGTLDSQRTQVVMESLLQKIVETGAEIAILDITGVLTVDTLVAQHLIRTVTAARLMGAECIISGIRPQIAQTIVHLGIDLSGVTTKATLADAFAMALRRNGLTVTAVNRGRPASEKSASTGG